MSPFQTVTCISLITAAALSAGEVAIEPRPFRVEAQFRAKVMPENALLLQLDAEAWRDFTIQSIAAHGSSVAKGEVLMQFESEEIERALEDRQQAIATRALAISAAEIALAQLRETAPHRLEAARRNAAIAQEQHASFTQAERKAEEEEDAAQQLERQKQWLDTKPEALRQLAHAERDAALALRYAEAGIPLELAQKSAELKSLKIHHQRDREMLAKLEHDRTLCTIRAPSDGIFYHGPIQDGRWVTGDLIKSLAVSGQPPTGKPFACLIPKASPMVLVAFTDAATAQPLTEHTQGRAILEGRDELDVPVQVSAVKAISETDGRYRVTLNARWPDGFAPHAAHPAEVHLITYHQAQAIAVPSDAIHYGVEGWSVELKLADGKTEPRPVKRGYRSGEMTEILSGLEAGQVIVAP